MSFYACDDYDENPNNAPELNAPKPQLPLWAPTPDGEWCPVHYSLWPIWKMNKGAMKKAGFQVSKFDNGYFLRFAPKK